MRLADSTLKMKVFTAAEFFAGIGLVRLALAASGVEAVWANDFDPNKNRLYEANFGSGEYRLADVRTVAGDDVPSIDIATASFPCTDLSLAGGRRGLAGEQSGMFWEFARVLSEMGRRRPGTILLENVPGLVTSHGGRDLAAVIERLNGLGYTCDIVQVNASRFVPQSRPRLFIIGAGARLHDRPLTADWLRPQRIIDFVIDHPELDLQAAPARPPEAVSTRLADIVERPGPDDSVWWRSERLSAFVESLTATHAERLDAMRRSDRVSWRTAYRRTRAGMPVWEIRADEIAGCLRTPRGGSSKQAVVEAGGGDVRVRWMNPCEYARLQGAPADFQFGGAPDSHVMFGFGDGVCVPAVTWVLDSLVLPSVRTQHPPLDFGLGR